MPALKSRHLFAEPPGGKRSAFHCSRREFLGRSAIAAAVAPFVLSDWARGAVRAADAKVAIVACRGYGVEVQAALKQAFDLLGGIGSLVKDKTVTVKLNLSGTDFTPVFGRPAGESVMTHFSTVLALGALLFDAGARRVRLVESTTSKDSLEATLRLGGWDLPALNALGKVEFENTRNLGQGAKYSELKVPGSGLMFSSFQLNHAYADTDVMMSLAKLKQHVTAGVTLSMKNMFGLTPTSLYGANAGREDALAGRDPLHSPGLKAGPDFGRVQLPGFKFKKDDQPLDPGVRVPRIITDLCAARPVHLAIIDGISAMSGGEGPWCNELGQMKLTKPGVLIVGLNPVSTDAVGTAVMGYANPRAARGEEAFAICENHLLLAEQAGLGTADLAQIDVRGMTIEKARYPYPPLRLGR